ncbi:MAG: LysR family transcriptional regulator [Comamonas sp. SCN 65-56]|uniref:LysR family transcriptional regulator n=1 Tax=Comamonas sp. SCN 65-56 TaxID=1660095 RepID=UPI00086E480D|nr:LysR family transcriptional regulator [Comamonas sp. SCN 65-56]ODS91553.1 MAG: LysR family transcriptional regulator [Comamonas sp. SCN 65-56]
MHDLNDMLYFAEVAERGSFAAAGRALGIPKSRLSRRISELEAQLGVRLLQRTTRTLSLTDAGQAFLAHCTAVRESAQAAADAVAQVQAVPRGTVRVTCPVTLAQTVLAQQLPFYLDRYPEVRLEMQVTNRVVNLVEEGVDVALRVRASLEDSGSMVVKRLDEVCQVLVASPGQLRRQGTPKVLEDLAHMDVLMPSAGDGRVSVRLINPQGKAQTLEITPRCVIDDLLSLKFAAMAGTGMGWLPDYMVAPELRDGRLVRLLTEWSQPRAIVHAVFASRRGMSPAVRSFLDFLGEVMPSHMGGSCETQPKIGGM